MKTTEIADVIVISDALKQCCWRFKSPQMQRLVSGWAIPKVYDSL